MHVVDECPGIDDFAAVVACGLVPFSSSVTNLSSNNLKASCAHNLTKSSILSTLSNPSNKAYFHLVNSLGEYI